MMIQSNRWLLALIFVVASAGFLLELWPLSAAAVAALGFVGRGFFAPSLGLLLDLAYGAPLGPMGYFFFPFTILGLLVVVLRYFGTRYFMNRSSQERL